MVRTLKPYFGQAKYLLYMIVCYIQITYLYYVLIIDLSRPDLRTQDLIFGNCPNLEQNCKIFTLINTYFYWDSKEVFYRF